MYIKGLNNGCMPFVFAVMNVTDNRETIREIGAPNFLPLLQNYLLILLPVMAAMDWYNAIISYMQRFCLVPIRRSSLP